jgi:hypothetical protein
MSEEISNREYTPIAANEEFGFVPASRPIKQQRKAVGVWSAIIPVTAQGGTLDNGTHCIKP